MRILVLVQHVAVLGEEGELNTVLSDVCEYLGSAFHFGIVELKGIGTAQSAIGQTVVVQLKPKRRCSAMEVTGERLEAFVVTPEIGEFVGDSDVCVCPSKS